MYAKVTVNISHRTWGGCGCSRNGMRYYECLFACVKSNKMNSELFPRDAPVGHRRGNNPVEYVFFLFLFPRDAPVGHRRGNNPVEYVFIFFIFIFVTRSHKKQCRILIEV